MRIIDWAVYSAGVIAGRAAGANACAEQIEEMRLMLREAETRQLDAEAQAADLEQDLELHRVQCESHSYAPLLGEVCQGCELNLVGTRHHTWRLCAAEWRRRFNEMDQKRLDLLDQVLHAQSSDSAKEALEAIINNLREQS